MMDLAMLQAVCDAFLLPAGARTIVPYGNGHINDTFLVTIASEPKDKRYILQRLNRYVFKRPEQVIENIERVTAHLAAKIARQGGDPARETLTLVPTRQDQRCFVDANGDYYRIYLFVERTVSYDLPDTEDLFRQAAQSFGNFQRQLADFPAELLHETIRGFHDTPARFDQLTDAIARDAAGRAALCKPEIEFALQYEREVHALADAGLPLRVTHNDTKLNNLLMDEADGRCVCVIDLDTVMPGLAPHDFGDAIRFGANSAAEDEENLDLVSLDLSMFEAYVRGYLRAAGAALTPEEIGALPMGAKLMTLECGLRFLADYLNGDVYFKTHKPDHNLIRARNQFALVRDIQRKWGEMHKIVGAQKAALGL